VSSSRIAWSMSADRGTARVSTNGSYPNYLDIRARNTVFTGMYAYRFGASAMSLGGRDGAERIYGDMVSTNYFQVLGTRPLIGRLFAPEDGEEPGGTPITVMSLSVLDAALQW
jgi:hypothetical protein